MAPTIKTKMSDCKVTADRLAVPGLPGYVGDTALEWQVEFAQGGDDPARIGRRRRNDSVGGMNRAIVVASQTDPYTTFAQFEQFADDWGAELVDNGDVGHLDTATGFGPWPDGERLGSELD